MKNGFQDDLKVVTVTDVCVAGWQLTLGTQPNSANFAFFKRQYNK